MGLFSPDPGLNYGFIAGAYVLLTLVSALLFVLQQEKLMTGVEGMWLIPAPAAVGVVWALALRHCQRRAAAREKRE